MAAAARRHVTVALSGDGGDEVFAGYNRYALSRWAWRRAGRVPPPARAAAARVLTAIPPASWDRGVARIEPLLPRALHVRNPGDKAHKLARLLRAAGPDDLWRAAVSQWEDPEAVAIGGREPPMAWHVPATIGDPTERMVFLDTITTLPDEMLVKVDRASMAVGLEVRVPLLDHRVVELAWGLPLDLRVRDGVGKWALRAVLHRYVPPALVDRPKMGFDPPVATWLRGPLRAWGSDLLDPDRVRAEGFLDAALVQRRWAEHQSGRRNWDYALWAVLMFESWLQQWGPLG
jgi:asparagine synthase (glutamine-hydrolysing)